MSKYSNMSLKGSLLGWGVSLCLIPIVMSLTSCSRREQKVPEKPAVKAVESTATVSSNVVTVLPVVSHESITVKHDEKDVTQSPTPLVANDIEAQRAMHERQAVMRARQAAFAEKMFTEELQKLEREIEKLNEQIQSVEARTDSSEAVKAAKQKLVDQRKAYDQERIKLPGMSDLWQKREAEKARLLTLKAQPETSERGKNIQEARDEINRLGLMMVNIEIGGRTNSPSLQQSVESLKAAEAGVGASLMTLPEYRDLLAKRQELQDKYLDLQSRQAEFLKKEQK